MAQQVHVVPDGDGWAFKHEGDDEPIGRAGTQGEAEQAAKAHAREHGDLEVVIQGRDGKIRDSDTMDRAHDGPGRDTVR